MRVESESKAGSGKRRAVLPEPAPALTTAFGFPLSALPPLRFIAIAAVLVGCSLASGCRSWNPWGKGFDDEYANLGAKARGSSSSGSQSLGLSAKSRQIERNLGVE